MNNNTILLYNNALNLNLKQTMNDANDVLYNMQSLKQFQWNISQIQKMKDGAQMQVNMAALALWRNFVLNEAPVGKMLFRNYDLSDEQIVKYENFLGEDRGLKWKYLTNLQAIKRKGECFTMDRYGLYKIENYNERISLNSTKTIDQHLALMDLFYDISSFEEISYAKKWPFYIYQYSHNLDVSNSRKYNYQNHLAKNVFIEWNDNLVKLLQGDNAIKDLLQNDGFFAQMGINNIRETLTHLQDIVGSSYEITEEMKNEVIARIEQKGIALYSYLPISKEFIFQHQNELDWAVMQKNPRIQWDWELINLYLRKVKETISEDKWPQYLLGSKAMYEFVGNYLNDEILSDIEKLYNI